MGGAIATNVLSLGVTLYSMSDTTHLGSLCTESHELPYIYMEHSYDPTYSYQKIILYTNYIHIIIHVRVHVAMTRTLIYIYTSSEKGGLVGWGGAPDTKDQHRCRPISFAIPVGRAPRPDLYLI